MRQIRNQGATGYANTKARKLRSLSKLFGSIYQIAYPAQCFGRGPEINHDTAIRHIAVIWPMRVNQRNERWQCVLIEPEAVAIAKGYNEERLTCCGHGGKYRLTKQR